MSEIIGIDPGRTGHITGIGTDGIAWSKPLPYIDKIIDETALVAIVDEHPDAIYFVERQRGQSLQGLGSVFSTGLNYGIIRGVLAAAKVIRYYVAAADWQKVMLRGEPKVKGSDLLKKQYTSVAERMWPTISFRGPGGGLKDGKAAAALIAEYGRRLLMGETSHQT